MTSPISQFHPDLVSRLAQLETAAARVIDRLAERAAYAGEAEYREIRGLMASLKGLLR